MCVINRVLTTLTLHTWDVHGLLCGQKDKFYNLALSWFSRLKPWKGVVLDILIFVRSLNGNPLKLCKDKILRSFYFVFGRLVA